MITFICCLATLIAGYFIYGSFIERIFGVDPSRTTPAYTHQDGVDYIPMSSWKVFMIQFLNIAGLGPIFGAIMGAKFGTASFLWIVLGRSLPELSMTIWRECFHYVITGKASRRLSGVILEITSSNSCAASLWS